MKFSLRCEEELRTERRSIYHAYIQCIQWSLNQKARQASDKSMQNQRKKSREALQSSTFPVCIYISISSHLPEGMTMLDADRPIGSSGLDITLYMRAYAVRQIHTPHSGVHASLNWPRHGGRQSQVSEINRSSQSFFSLRARSRTFFTHVYISACRQ